MARQTEQNGANGSGTIAARSIVNEAFDANSFLYGGNAQYVEQLHARYLRDPATVDAEWHDFFAGLSDDPAAIQKNADGPAWKQAGWPIAANGELVSALDGDWSNLEKGFGDKLKAKAAQ